ncbi:hypothetical protein AX15_007929 [Amanita polypyramis BW_CC]|nr:hypothetical protein AX15_007929 [Amanita polypyramis BW_CC]
MASGAERLEALLQQEQLRTRELQNEIASLRQALELAKAGTDANTSPDLQLEQQLAEVKTAYANDKAQWDAERSSLRASSETATKAQESAIKDADFFREQYARASGFVTSIREENQELEERAKIAEDQAKSGVAMIKATYGTRVKELESHVEKWQMMAAFLIQKDQRTDNDELRRRAAEQPELKAKCQSLEEEIGMLNAEIMQLEEDLRERDKTVGEAGYWKQEADRLAAELDEAQVEMGRPTQVSEGSDVAYRCLWRTEANKPCDEIFQTVEDLKNHFYSAGHIHWD